MLWILQGDKLTTCHCPIIGIDEHNKPVVILLLLQTMHAVVVAIVGHANTDPINEHISLSLFVGSIGMCTRS